MRFHVQIAQEADMTPTRAELDDLDSRFRELQRQSPELCLCGAILDDSGLCPECGHDWSDIIHWADNPPDDFVPDQGG
jgi:hypothetical protein